MFARTEAMAKEAKDIIAARAAQVAGHRRNGGWEHEAYVDEAYGEKYCIHCEEYLGKA